MHISELRYLLEKDLKDSHHLIETLLKGVSRDDLEKLLASDLKTDLQDPRVSIARMNLIGGLRASGYQVSGGRSDRSSPYQVLHWAPPKSILSVSEWPEDLQEVVSFIRSLPRVNDDRRALIHSRMSLRDPSYIAHENSVGYLYCYELARDQGFLYQFPDQTFGVIIQRFENLPRYRLFCLEDTNPVYLLRLSSLLSRVSLVSVSILNISLETSEELKKLDHQGSISRRREAIYSTFYLSKSPEKYLNKRAMSQLRKNDRSTFLVEDSDWSLRPAFDYVIQTWKNHLEDRHRQLAITRDFVANQGPYSLRYLGVRNPPDDALEKTLPSPVSAYILDPLANRPDIAADLMNKSLNYSAMPFGQPGTADWLLVRVSEQLFNRGIHWLQAGGFDGGGAGLPAHKERFAEATFSSLSFSVSNDHLKRTDLYKEEE